MAHQDKRQDRGKNKPATRASAPSAPRLGSRGRPEHSRSTILKAAAREFAETGIEGARTDVIARQARVNKALIYYYFKDKESLYGSVLDNEFSGIQKSVMQILDSDLPPRRKVLEYMGAYFDFIAEHQTFAKLMQREMLRARHGESVHLDRLVKTYFEPLFRRLGDVLRQGTASGDFRNVDPAHFIPSMIAMVVFYFNSAPVMRKLFNSNPLSAHKVAERRAAILDFISAALFEPRGTPQVPQGGRP